jgi:hypothetical protein
MAGRSAARRALRGQLPDSPRATLHRCSVARVAARALQPSRRGGCNAQAAGAPGVARVTGERCRGAASVAGGVGGNASNDPLPPPPGGAPWPAPAPLPTLTGTPDRPRAAASIVSRSVTCYHASSTSLARRGARACGAPRRPLPERRFSDGAATATGLEPLPPGSRPLWQCGHLTPFFRRKGKKNKDLLRRSDMANPLGFGHVTPGLGAPVAVGAAPRDSVQRGRVKANAS